jgi:hypothetical protein
MANISREPRVHHAQVEVWRGEGSCSKKREKQGQVKTITYL